jgi:hypothetical protein
MPDTDPNTPTQQPPIFLENWVKIYGAQETDNAAAEIYAKELEQVTNRRVRLNMPSPDPAKPNFIGLSLSGGGIRSAAFSLGVVQVLAKHNRLKYVDYLSTVSGGGYLGAFMSSYLNWPGTSTDPFDAEISASTTGPGRATVEPFNRQVGCSVTPVAHIRRRARFLSGLTLLGPTAVLFGIYINLVLLTPYLLTAVAVFPLVLDFFELPPVDKLAEESGFINFPFYLGAAFLLLLSFFPFIQILEHGHFLPKRYRECWQEIVQTCVQDKGLIRKLAKPVLLLFVMPLVVWLGLLLADRWDRTTMLVGAIALVLLPLAAAGVARKRSAFILQMLLVSGAVAVTLGFGLVVSLVVNKLRSCLSTRDLIVSALAVYLWGRLTIDLNLTSLHRIYREQLRVLCTFVRK